MFMILLRKEMLEQLRMRKILITLAVFLVIGLMSPILAKYTPIILSSVPDLPEGFVDLIPEPTLHNAIEQYVKNISQFGVLLVILLNMGSVAQEKERGTVAMLLTKPIRPTGIVVAKWTAAFATLLLGTIIAALGFTLYACLIFEPVHLVNFVLLNGLLVLFLSVYMTLTILASTLARSQLGAAALSFTLLVVVLVSGTLPRIGDLLPGELLRLGTEIMTGTGIVNNNTLAVCAGIILFSLAAACLTIEKQEL